MSWYTTQASYKITTVNKWMLTFMVTALNVLTLYAGSCFAWFAIPSYILAASFGAILAVERLYGYSAVVWALTCAICLLIIARSTFVLPYMLLSGAYAVIREALRSAIKDKFICFTLRLLICNILVAAVVASMVYIFKIDPLLLLPDMPMYLAVILMEAILIAMDGVVAVFEVLYKGLFRKHLT